MPPAVPEGSDTAAVEGSDDVGGAEDEGLLGEALVEEGMPRVEAVCSPEPREDDDVVMVSDTESAVQTPVHKPMRLNSRSGEKPEFHVPERLRILKMQLEAVKCCDCSS